MIVQHAEDMRSSSATGYNVGFPIFRFDAKGLMRPEAFDKCVASNFHFGGCEMKMGWVAHFSRHVAQLNLVTSLQAKGIANICLPTC
jgi:hypothetical protein